MPSTNCGDSENGNWTESDRRPTVSISQSDDHCVGPGGGASNGSSFSNIFSSAYTPNGDGLSARNHAAVQPERTDGTCKGLPGGTRVRRCKRNTSFPRRIGKPGAPGQSTPGAVETNVRAWNVCFQRGRFVSAWWAPTQSHPGLELASGSSHPAWT